MGTLKCPLQNLFLDSAKRVSCVNFAILAPCGRAGTGEHKITSMTDKCIKQDSFKKTFYYYQFNQLQQCTTQRGIFLSRLGPNRLDRSRRTFVIMARPNKSPRVAREGNNGGRVLRTCNYQRDQWDVIDGRQQQNVRADRVAHPKQLRNQGLPHWLFLTIRHIV